MSEMWLSQHRHILMGADRFDQLAQQLAAGGTRRGLLRLLAALPLAAALAVGNDAAESVAKRRKSGKGKKGKGKKGKGKCAKPGKKPKRGASCCKGAILADGTCQRCDVCTSGCAFDTVQRAVETAGPGATVTICPGAYQENLSLTGLRTLRGAGAGAKGTILRGNGAAPVVSIAAGGVVALQRLRITGGSSEKGGGVRNQGTTTLVGCTVSENAATDGGGLYNDHGTLLLTDCDVSENMADFGGGGLYNDTGTLTLTGSTVAGNAASGLGGGILNFGGTLNLTDSKISGNTGPSSGGGIFNGGGVTTIFDAASRVTDNTADGGGGIFLSAGTVTLASAANVTGNTPDNCAGNAAIPLCSG